MNLSEFLNIKTINEEYKDIKAVIEINQDSYLIEKHGCGICKILKKELTFYSISFECVIKIYDNEKLSLYNGYGYFKPDCDCEENKKEIDNNSSFTNNYIVNDWIEYRVYFDDIESKIFERFGYFCFQGFLPDFNRLEHLFRFGSIK